MRAPTRLAHCALVLLLMSACTPAGAKATPRLATSTQPNPSPVADQAAIPGPGGLSLSEEIGAVMMVGFRGPLTDSVRQSWESHQFGGLLIVPINENAGDPGSVRDLIKRVRATMHHPLLVATDQEGGGVCLQASGVPCRPGPRDVAPQGQARIESQMKEMSSGLKRLGFNVNFAPVADVWDGSHPFMRERSYGQDPAAVAADVTAAISGIQAGGLLAAAKHFPGHGAADGDSHLALPVVRLSRATLKARDWVPFTAAARSGVDFVMLGHLNVPALDSALPSSLSPVVLRALREDIGYQGVVISDDLQMGALGTRFPPPEAAVRFLQNGGDMVIVEHDLPVAEAVYAAIREAVISGRYSRALLDASVEKILELQAKISG